MFSLALGDFPFERGTVEGPLVLLAYKKLDVAKSVSVVGKDRDSSYDEAE